LREAFAALSAPREVAISRPQVGRAAAGLTALTLLLHVLPENNALVAAAKVVCPALTLGVLPGLLLTLCFRSRARMGVLELAGLGIALSLALPQFWTFLCLGLHLPVALATEAAVVLVLAGALLLWLRPAGPDWVLTLNRGELLVGLFLLALSVLFYLKGSPIFSDEDQIHVGIVRRLTVLDHPAPGNIYHAPGIVYTHPFPGTHFFMAMVSRLGGIDPLFTYHKLRFLWGAATFLFLYLLARLVFARRQLVAAVVTAAGLLLLNGSFADFWVLYWGQLAPYSHPSDVAMSVLLPGLLVLTLTYYQAAAGRESAFLLAATLALATTLTVVHIRETIQFLMYNGCYVLVCVCLLRDWARLRKVGLVIGAVVVLAAAYGLYHHLTVSHVAEYDAAQKAKVLAALQNSSPAELFGRPIPLGSLASLFVGWHPALILLGPLVCLAFPRRPFVLLIGTIAFVYLLIFRFPLLSLLFTYVTYHEALMTPLRNLSFFNYLFTGAILYVLAANLARIPTRLVSVPLAVGLGVALGLASRVELTWWLKNADLLFWPALGLYAVAFLLSLWPRMSRWVDGLRDRVPTAAWAPVFAALLVAAVSASVLPQRSPLSLHHVNTHSALFSDNARIFLTPRDALAGLKPRRVERWPLVWSHAAFADYDAELVGTVFSSPNEKLRAWAAKSLPADAVLAVNTFNACPSPPFLPQQIDAWPAIASFNLSYVKQLFPDFYHFCDRTMLRYHTQPFFNTAETLEERLEFLNALKITHVLVDPMYYADLKAVLARWPDHFHTVYDDGAWAVVEVAAH